LRGKRPAPAGARQLGEAIPPDGRRLVYMALGAVVNYDMAEYNAAIKLKANETVIAQNRVVANSSSSALPNSSTEQDRLLGARSFPKTGTHPRIKSKGMLFGIMLAQRCWLARHGRVKYYLVTGAGETDFKTGD
jgi:hypothetical protein